MKRIIILIVLMLAFVMMSGCNDDGGKEAYTSGDSDTVSVGDNVIDLGDDEEERDDDGNNTSSNDGWTKVY